MSDRGSGAAISGGLTLVMGAAFILAGFGILPMGVNDPTVPAAQQRMLTICMGSVFSAGGMAVIVHGADAPWVTLVKRGLALVIAAGLTILFAWVAIGPGARGLSSSLAILGPAVNEFVGRCAFGLGAIMGLLVLACIICDLLRRSPSRM